MPEILWSLSTRERRSSVGWHTRKCIPRSRNCCYGAMVERKRLRPVSRTYPRRKSATAYRRLVPQARTRRPRCALPKGCGCNHRSAMGAGTRAVGQPELIVCDRFRLPELQDCVNGTPVVPRVTRWSEASEDIRALRRMALDRPLARPIGDQICDLHGATERYRPQPGIRYGLPRQSPTLHECCWYPF